MDCHSQSWILSARIDFERYLYQLPVPVKEKYLASLLYPVPVHYICKNCDLIGFSKFEVPVVCRYVM